MKALQKTDGRVRLYRDETYNHRTTAKVEWIVTTIWDDGREMIVASCNTRKEALVWFDIYARPAKVAA